MSAEDDLAVVRSARGAISEQAELVNTALGPLHDAPGADSDLVMEAVQRLWFVDDDLAWSEDQIQRRMDGDDE